MKIPVNLQQLLPLATAKTTPLLQQLKVGQVLQARVLGQVQPSLVRLQIATTELLARTPVALDAGTRLRLSVMQTGPQTILRILHDAPATRPPQREQVVRHALPRQMSSQQVRAAITEMRSSASTPRQHEAVSRFSAILNDAAVKPGQLTATAIRHAVSASGLFHEARLAAQSAATAAPDLKLSLLKLMRTLTADTQPRGAGNKLAPQDNAEGTQSRSGSADSLIQRLVRLIEATVSRVQLQQAASLPAEDTSRQAWQIDLPVTTGEGAEDLAMRIEHDEEAGKTGGGAGWSVNLVFDFDTIGRLQCRVGLNGDRVATSFWCDDSVTHARLEQRLPTLEQALQAQGLEVVHLSGAVGEPREPLLRIPLPSSLLDERA